LDYNWTAVNLLNGFSFLVIFLSYHSGSCDRLSWLNCQLSSARQYSSIIIVIIILKSLYQTQRDAVQPVDKPNLCPRLDSPDWQANGSTL